MATINQCAIIEPFIANEEDSLVSVGQKLRESLLRQLFIVDNKNKPVGLISITDMNNRVVAEGKDPNTLKAKDIMTSPVIVRKSNDDVQTVYKDMRTKKQMLNAVVDENQKIKGMITVGELLKCLTQH